MSSAAGDSLAHALEGLRAAEKAQAMRYRRLAALAEEQGDEPTAQRLHDLHADEQHHLSRLTARLVELGFTPVELSTAHHPATDLIRWEPEARELEAAEVQRYQSFLETSPDPATRALAEAILEVELHHRDELSGKWTMA